MMVYQLLLILSIILETGLILLIASQKNKKQIHYAIMSIAGSLLIWNIAVFLMMSFPENAKLLKFSEILYFTGIILVSQAVLFSGFIYAKHRIKFSWKYGLFIIVPILSIIVLLTNSYHHFYYVKFGLIPSENDLGWFYIIHTIYSYSCIVVGLFCFFYFAIKNFGFFSKQALLIFFAILISLVADSFSTFRIFDWSSAFENIVFSVTIILIILAIIRYNFLSVIPIALKWAVDSISDVYIVFSEEYEIVDFNNAFLANWPGAERKKSIKEVIKESCPGFDEDKFENLVSQSIFEKSGVSFEIERPYGEKIKYYIGEITPIIVKDVHVGTIIIIKDITEQKNNMEEVLRLNESLKSIATKDWLTQIYNRYYFDEQLELEIESLIKQQEIEADAMKNEINFGLIMFDIDYFKIYNDLNGHQAGDELLKTLVNVVEEVLFSNNILCRYGGEEFAVICCNNTFGEVETIAEKIRRRVADYEFAYQNTQPEGNITVSVGAVFCVPPYLKRSDLIRKADQNLYLAKNSGRNKVVMS